MSTPDNGPPADTHRSHVMQARYAPPPGARQLLLARHGSTEHRGQPMVEIGGRVCADPHLSPAGVAQAQRLAERLRAERFDRVFITPLQRTLQTLQPLLDSLEPDRRAWEPQPIEDLREAHMGDYEPDLAARTAAGDPILARMRVESSWDMIPNVELMADFAARVRRGVEAAAALTPPDGVGLVVCHGGVIADICREATGARPFGFFVPENASLTRLVVLADGRWELRGFNDIGHLTGL